MEKLHREHDHWCASVLDRQRNAGGHGAAGEGGAAKQTVDPLPEDHRAGLYQQFFRKRRAKRHFGNTHRTILIPRI